MYSSTLQSLHNSHVSKIFFNLEALVLESIMSRNAICSFFNVNRELLVCSYFYDKNSCKINDAT